jgi:hypothetical protein
VKSIISPPRAIAGEKSEEEELTETRVTETPGLFPTGGSPGCARSAPPVASSDRERAMDEDLWFMMLISGLKYICISMGCAVVTIRG